MKSLIPAAEFAEQVLELWPAIASRHVSLAIARNVRRIRADVGAG